MPLLTGQEYLKSIADSRQMHMDGGLIPDITNDPRTAGVARAMARIYDLQHDPDKRDVLTYVDPDTGARHPRAFMSPRTLEDLLVRHQALRMNMEPSCGMLGRAPDFLNVWLAAMDVGAEVFDRSRNSRDFGSNVRRYYRHVRDNNLLLTHVLVNPQPDRSRSVWEQSPEQDIALKITRETADGYYVNGSRMVGTLAHCAHEVLVMPSSVKPNTPNADAYCFGFALPLATKGLHLISRSPLVPRDDAPARDFPLSSQFEENDAVLVFDDVFVPWERTFFYRDAELASSYTRATFTSAHTSHQIMVRSLVKTEFLVGLVQEVARAVNGDKIPEVLQQLSELYMMLETHSAVIYKAEREFVQTPFGTIAPNHRILASVQIGYYDRYTQMIDTLRSFAAGQLVAAPSIAELDGPVGELVRRHCVAANMDAEQWLTLMRVVIDVAMSGFGARQQVYEKYYQGPPHMVRAMYARNYPRKDELSQKVKAAIAMFGNG